ncbi:solute carrier organic anion transporter [Halorussus ruber]|uniref:solute carrier organic anion transporter n=1 Tax=Halorussus ruber TaxID=1126238 RepID=UPI001093006C|nr:solute carrier organic anion transporter [Halorussus ruber]
MKRRNLLKGIAASSVLSTGLAGASSRPGAKPTAIDKYDRLRIVSDGKTVGTVENPTWETVKEVETTLDDDQTLVTPDDECTAFCRSNCDCSPCAYGCYDCCDPADSICSCCSQVEDPDSTECCSGC